MAAEPCMAASLWIRMVNEAPMQCRSDQMRLLLHGDSTPEQSALIESHLSQCSDCRQWLNGHAAPDDFWGETAELLRRPVELLSPDAPHLAGFEDRPHADPGGPTRDMLSADTQRAQLTGRVVLEHLTNWCDEVHGSDSGIGRIGKYLVQEVVGHGGMGVGLGAVDTELGRTVAIKTLLQPVAVDTSSRDRLIREARAVASLKHDHVIDMHSIEHWRDVPFIVMPFVSGGTLGEYAERGSFDPSQVLSVARQLATALCAAHDAGLTHRDIKPSNILLDDGLRHVLLADFGLARAGGDMTVTRSGMAPGTPQWMSPEQATASAIDHRSDQFSLGSVLYWMTTGRYPFDSDSCYATLMNLVHQEALPIAQCCPGTPSYLVTLIERMMCKVPDRRFDDMGQIVGLLDACLNHCRDPRVPIPAELRSAPTRSERQKSRTKRLVMACCGSLALVTAVAAVPLVRQLNLPDQSDASPTAGDHVDRPSSPPTALHQPALPQTATHSRPESGPAPVDPLQSPLDTAAQETSATASAPPSFQVERYGPLDEIELSNAVDDLQKDSNVVYWLRRLAYLEPEQISPALIPLVMQRSEADDVASAELARVILAKNPFIEVHLSAQQSSETDMETDNPFVEVEQE